MSHPLPKCIRTTCCLFLLGILTLLPLPLLTATAQTITPESDASLNRQTGSDLFRLERIPVEGGAELLTISARLDGLDGPVADRWIPMVSVLRDTLGDNDPENDRLRYLWPLTYTRPTMAQRFASAIPFLYTRVSDKEKTSKTPPPVLDLAAPDRDVWDKIFWTALQTILLDPYGTPIKASTRAYRRNASDYRKSHIVRALSVLALYQAISGTAPFSDAELAEIQARLLLTDKTFGGIVDDIHLRNYYNRQVTNTRDSRARNWELLRQRAEAESLVFEPLQMPDGSTTHAILWVARADLSSPRTTAYSKRFLNIANPWKDPRLLDWRGYTETRYFDAENRPVAADTPEARGVELIPLALYGLDNPKIPMVLVDFRDGLNPKKREMSRRALEDVTRNVLSLSRFGDLPYFLGRTVFDFVTGRRGMDINQPSRLRTYSQLKLLLSLQESMDPGLRQRIQTRLEAVSLNPLESSLQAEVRLARKQYEALVAYASRPNGLPARIERDRRAELVPLQHGKAERILFQIAKVLTFGKYVHREKAAPENEGRLDIARKLTYHTRFLREVSRSSPQIEVVWDLKDVRRSLRFIAEHGQEADSRAINAAASIFAKTADSETRRKCLDTLARIDKPKARGQLLRISKRTDLDPAWRAIVDSYINDDRPTREPVVGSARRSDISTAETGGEQR
ncbi:MAG TPA: hypothetical protein VMM84_02800 [Pyrinomonadaceae bacterium]|nr:hypothetical protein [Pyrinomonadaceae bacterium]